MRYLIFILSIILLNIYSKPNLIVVSPAFTNNNAIPSKYTCSGENTSPEIDIKGIPKGAKTLAIIVDDPDAPHGGFVHWVMWNISPMGTIDANTAPGVQGKNGAKENKYTGPCPPTGEHHYHFKVYALDARVDIPASSDKTALLKAMEPHIIAAGELVGTFKKP
jgi:Raf kinase inhibitor-like YbhB/YbcL family protein